MKYSIILVLVMFFSSCLQEDNYYISDLDSETVKFEELPQVIKDFYKDPKGYSENGFTKVACFDKDCRCYTTAVKSCFGPRVAYIALKNYGPRRVYRISRKKPYPYVIYENKLYITNEKNIFREGVDPSALKITCYTLLEKEEGSSD